MKSAIGISEPIRDSNQTVRFNLDIPFRLRRYFEDTELQVGYDFDISEVSDQVLAIPAVILAVPIGWANNVDVEAGYVEKKFVNYVPNLKNAYERLYPGVFDNKSELRCKSVESAPKAGSQTAMLFTGGVDSTTTFYRNRDRSPRVINILQKRDSDVKREHQSDYISRFSDLMGVESSTIDTNAHSMLNHEVLSIDFKGGLYREWWNAVHYGIYYMAVCAPLAYHYGITRLLQGSSYTTNRDLPDIQPYVIKALTWGETRCEIAEPDMQRYEKIDEISEFIDEYDDLWISSCYDRSIRRNCMECEKCFRTALAAATVGVPPDKLGFKITEESIRNMNEFLSNFGGGGFHACMWQEIQTRADRADFAIDDDEVYELLMDADIHPEQAGRSTHLGFKYDIYKTLPGPIDIYLYKWHNRAYSVLFR